MLLCLHCLGVGEGHIFRTFLPASRVHHLYLFYNILKFLFENEIQRHLYIHNIDICCSNVWEKKKMVNDPYFSLSRQT